MRCAVKNVRFVFAWNKRLCNCLLFQHGFFFYFFICLCPYNNTELHSSYACPCLVRFIVFTRLALCHYTGNIVSVSFSPVKLATENSRCNGIILDMDQNLWRSSSMLAWFCGSSLVFGKREAHFEVQLENTNQVQSLLCQGQWYPAQYDTGDDMTGAHPPLTLTLESVVTLSVLVAIFIYFFC